MVEARERCSRAGTATPEDPPLIPLRGAPPSPPIPPQRWREPIVFDIFSRDGYFLGTLPLPDRAKMLRMRDNHVWGVVLDEFDVPHVVRWRIEPLLSARERGS